MPFHLRLEVTMDATAREPVLVDLALQGGACVAAARLDPLPFRRYRCQNRGPAEQPLNGFAHRLAIALGQQLPEMVFWQANSKQGAAARLRSGPEENRPI
jgi:hypothetical protein